ncbi:MAG TPA: hypothetical protein VFA95_10720 [Gammaproteobacteria bacterium]|nr:hypothetical protein [Gammaproteobacteria bacterium]
MAEQEIDSLDPQTYHRVVAPALQVAADTAASRGDPDLYNDMPSMLALMAMVHGLSDCLCAAESPDQTRQLALERAPAGACVMVLQESGLDEVQVADCLWALSAAYGQLVERGVIGPERGLVDDAWQHQHAGEREAAIGVLGLAAARVVAAIDQWERGRGHDPDE